MARISMGRKNSTKLPGASRPSSRQKQKAPIDIEAFTTEGKHSTPRQSQYVPSAHGSQVTFVGSLSSHLAPTEPPAPTTERGPDGIRTRICDRREVLCCRYTTGPIRI